MKEFKQYLLALDSSQKAALLLAVIAGILFLAFSLISNLTRDTDGADLSTTDKTYLAEGIRLEIFYKEGLFYYEGVIEVPTPCNEVVTAMTIQESLPETVTIEFTTQDYEGICSQVIDQKPVKGNVEVSEEATFVIKRDNREVTPE